MQPHPPFNAAELGRFCLDSLVRFVNVVPPPGTDQAGVDVFFGEDKEALNRLVGALSPEELVQFVEWQTVQYHEILHFQQFVGTRTGLSLYHFLTHANEVREYTLLTGGDESARKALIDHRLQGWATIAPTETDPPIRLTRKIYAEAETNQPGVFLYQSNDANIFVSYVLDDKEGTSPVLLGAQRLFENWAHLWEREQFRDAYVHANFEPQLGPEYTTIERAIWRAIGAQLEGNSAFELVNRIIVMALNTGTTDDSRAQGSRLCGLKLYRILLALSDRAKEKRGPPGPEDLDQIERFLEEAYGYVPSRDVFELLAAGELGTGCSANHEGSTLQAGVWGDVSEWSIALAKAALEFDVFSDVSTHTQMLNALPRPVLNFFRGDEHTGYDLRFPKNATAEQLTRWILWFFQVELFSQSDPSYLYCPVKPDDFYCRLKIPECGKASLRSESAAPVECLFFDVVRAFEGRRKTRANFRLETPIDHFVALSRPDAP